MEALFFDLYRLDIYVNGRLGFVHHETVQPASEVCQAPQLQKPSGSCLRQISSHPEVFPENTYLPNGPSSPLSSYALGSSGCPPYLRAL